MAIRKRVKQLGAKMKKTPLPEPQRSGSGRLITVVRDEDGDWLVTNESGRTLSRHSSKTTARKAARQRAADSDEFNQYQVLNPDAESTDDLVEERKEFLGRADQDVSESENESAPSEDEDGGKGLGARALGAAKKFDEKMGEVGDRVMEFDEKLGELDDEDSGDSDGYEPLDMEEFGFGGGGFGGGSGSDGYQDIDPEEFGFGGGGSTGLGGPGGYEDIDPEDYGFGGEPTGDIDLEDFGFGEEDDDWGFGR